MANSPPEPMHTAEVWNLATGEPPQVLLLLIDVLEAWAQCMMTPLLTYCQSLWTLLRYSA